MAFERKRDALAVGDEGAQIIESHREERPDAQVVTAGAAGEGQAAAADVDEPARPAGAKDETPPGRVEPDQAGEQEPASGERQPAGLIERIPGPDGDGTEVLIVRNSDGKRL